LLTGDAIDADDAFACGMVSKVFAPDELVDRTLEFARRIARSTSRITPIGPR
jgi:enoyl-CoA hydratase